MSTVGAVLPVWCEDRYLGLVLEQMALVNGPRIIYWQDEPLFWLSDQPRPSGWNSRVKDILAQFPGQFEIVKMQRAPTDTDPRFGGFAALAQLASSTSQSLGIDVVLWFDSDWLLTLEDTQALLALIEAQPEPKLWSVQTLHYWRSFDRIYSDTPISVGFPSRRTMLWADCNYAPSDIIRTEIWSYHPSYVMTDAEMYRKVVSWGHADLFQQRQFYEKEWIGGDESQVKPRPAPHMLPREIADRLAKWGALLP